MCKYGENDVYDLKYPRIADVSRKTKTLTCTIIYNIALLFKLSSWTARNSFFDAGVPLREIWMQRKREKTRVG